jgi:FtsH-binding integral membrane protein
MQFNEDILVSPQDIAREQQKFIVKVYGFMAAALAITGLVAYFTVTSDSMLAFIFQSKWVFISLLVVKLLLVGTLAIWIQKISSQVALAVFILYAILTGFVFAGLFLVYTLGSIASTFFITAGLFAVMSAYGYYTGNDLTKFGSLLFMLLIGLIIASIVNLFLASDTLHWITTYVGVFIFTGLIAYDTQKIKDMGGRVQEGTEEYRKGAIVGAFSLFLDFINLFILLLRIFGSRR